MIRKRYDELKPGDVFKLSNGRTMCSSRKCCLPGMAKLRYVVAGSSPVRHPP
jgi:hypothetical protein